MTSPEKLLGIAGAMLAIAIGCGAFGAHALKDILTIERLETWQTAVQYQAWNALGIMIVILVGKTFSINVKPISILLLIGIFIFSGSLYILCLTDISWLGAITPIGGVLFIVGWSLFGWKLIIKK